MPFVSQQQRKWAYTKEGTKALGGKKNVAEWQKASSKNLPKYAPKKKKIKHIEITPMFSDVIAQKVINKNKIKLILPNYTYIILIK